MIDSVEYIGYVRSLVLRTWKMKVPYFLLDDMIQVGFLGLVKAIERYDDSTGVPFKSYAALRIKGEVRDFLRLENPKGARREHLTPERMKDFKILSLGTTGEDGEDFTPLSDRMAVEDKTLEVMLDDALGVYLTAREKYVVEQCVIGNRYLGRVGKELGISESRTCQIRQRGIKKLKECMKPSDWGRRTDE